MPRIDAYRHGVPAWIDVSSPDIETTAAFYTRVFGWEAGPDMGPDAGGYRLFTKSGLNVAGIGPTTGGPPAWTTYIKVDDIDTTAGRIADLGGTPAVPPMDLPNDSGRIAFGVDPSGAFFGLFQPGLNHSGAQLVNETGTVVWNELATRDADGAGAFYSGLLGWTWTDMPEMNYRIFSVSGRTTGGMMPMGDDMPAEVPAHWLVYFAVDDVPATLAAITEAGGVVVAGPMDSPPGPLAVATDPTGAMFAIGAFSEIDDPNAWPD